MFIRNDLISSFGEILKDFEVALRSYVVDVVMINFDSDARKFEEKIQEIKNTMDIRALDIKPMFAMKNVNKISNILRESSKNLFDKLEFTHHCFTKQEHVDDGDVVYLSQLVDIMFLLYNPLFISFGKKFSTPENLDNLLSSYVKLRNATAHPGSIRITYDDVNKVSSFILSCTDYLPKEFFWFASSALLKNKISVFKKKLVSKDNIKHNISLVSKKYEQLLLRRNELKILHDLLIGDSDYIRTSGVVALHGYGGVGKTAIALEFCYDIIQNSLNSEPLYTHILWVTSKEEELYFDRHGTILLRELSPQYHSYNGLINLLLGMFNNECNTEEEFFQMVTKYKILIVIDNIETMKGEEKKKIHNFINRCPRNVQFLITSREFENIAEKNIEISGFRDKEKGIDFIKYYCSMRLFEDNFSSKQYDQFLRGSCGNTLVMTLMLDRVIEGTMNIDESIRTLQLSAHHDLEVIAEFMYKNMFSTVIDDADKLSSSSKEIIRDILNILLLYGESIDFHSIRELADCNSYELEDLISKFVNKSIVDRIDGEYALNEMATSFVKLKLLPSNIQLNKLLIKIEEFKRKTKEDLEILYNDTQKYPSLLQITEQWVPDGSTESIVVAKAYRIYGDVKNLNLSINVSEYYLQILNEYNKLEQRGYHPYVSYQKARTLKLFLTRRCSRVLREKIIEQIIESFDSVQINIASRYNQLIATSSYPTFLMQYGVFLLKYTNKLVEAYRYIERARDYYESYDDDDNKMVCNSIMAETCCKIYLIDRDIEYINSGLKSVQYVIRVLERRKRLDSRNLEILKNNSLLELFLKVSKGKYKLTEKDYELLKMRVLPRSILLIREELKRLLA